MQKIIKSCVQIVGKGICLGKPYFKEVPQKDPKLIKYSKKVQCIRFYDLVQTIDDKNVCKYESKNFSNWIYYGKRISIDEVREFSKFDFHYKNMIPVMESENIEFICVTENGFFFPLNDGDITYEEYLESIKDNNSKTKKKCINI